MKRVAFYLITILVVIGGIYVWGHRREFAFLSSWLPTRSSDGEVRTSTGEPLEWKAVDDATLGFKIEMPGDPQRVAVQADNEMGSTEPVSMLIVKPEPDHTFAIAWAEKPPVARINDLVPEKTLDQARDGALNRTGTTLVSETRTNPQGYPGRDIVAHNVGGGMLDTRFVYAGTRLYMLVAASPSAAARHEEEVVHFFNSFSVASNKQLPESIPASTQ